MSDRSVVFDRELMSLFAAASHDSNPLHTSVEYARDTPFGEPVVFGVLAGLAVLAELPRDRRARRITLSCASPVFLDRRYEISTVDTGECYQGELRHHDQAALRATIEHSVPGATGRHDVPDELAPMRDHPAQPVANQLRAAGDVIDGRYRASRIAELTARLDLGGVLGGSAMTALLWSSYLTGMELPGQQALLSELTVSLLADGPDGEHWYHAEVAHLDQRFNLMRVSARLHNGANPTAEARIHSFVRPSPTKIRPARPRIVRRGDGPPADRTAVVIGASRGLGAATAVTLAERGYAVTGCYLVSRSRAAEFGGSIRMVQGDAADEGFCARLAGEIRERTGRADVLVCSASPTLRPMRLTAGTTSALTDYIAASVALVAAPIAAFLPLLEQTAGQVLVVSSHAVDAPSADWPHYAAAKGAIERLIDTLVLAHPRVRFTVIRPPKMNTGYVATLVTDEPVTSPWEVAAGMVLSSILS